MSRQQRQALALFLFALIFSASPCPCLAARSSSTPSHPAPSADAEILRDTPLYPPLQNYDSETPYSLYTDTFSSKQPNNQDFSYNELESGQTEDIPDLSEIDNTKEQLKSELEYISGTGNTFDYDKSKDLQYDKEETDYLVSDESDDELELTNLENYDQLLTQILDATGTLKQDYGKENLLDKNVDNIFDNLIDDPDIETEKETHVQNTENMVETRREKRSKESQRPARVKTGDTILNTRGAAVRDAIGDAAAMPGAVGSTSGASSRVDAFIIRPDSTPRNFPREPHAKPLTNQLDVWYQCMEAKNFFQDAWMKPVQGGSPGCPDDEYIGLPRISLQGSLVSLIKILNFEEADQGTLQAEAPKDERELLVVAHSRVRIPCDLHNVTNLRWFRDKEQVSVGTGPAAGESMWRESEMLVISRAAPHHASAWRCAGLDSKGVFISGKPVRLLIYESVRSVYLKVDGRRLDAFNTWVPVRDKTVLEVHCVAEGGVPTPDIVWKLFAVEPNLDHRPYLRIHHTNYSIEGVASSRAVVTAARELHNASLHCETSQRSVPTAPPATTPPPTTEVKTTKLEIRVTYPPSFVISRWPGFGVALIAGNSAALRCDVDANPPAKAFWLRDDMHQSSSPPPLDEGPEARNTATLRWEILKSEQAGWYRCRASWLEAEYSSIGYYLNVLSPEDGPPPTPPAPPSEQQTVDVPVGGDAQLNCPKGSVGCWWRREGEANTSHHPMIPEEHEWVPTGSTRAHGVLTIKDALYQDGGEYRCVGASAEDANRMRELKRVTIRVNGGVTATTIGAAPTRTGWRMQCGACGHGVKVYWLVKHQAPKLAGLIPDLAQYCYRAELHVTEPDEIWCVAVSDKGGAVAVFPRRTPHSSSTHIRYTEKEPDPDENAANLVYAPVYLVHSALFMLLMD